MIYIFHHRVKGVSQSFFLSPSGGYLKTPCYSVSSVVNSYHLVFMTMSWKGIAGRSQFHMISTFHHNLIAWMNAT